MNSVIVCIVAIIWIIVDDMHHYDDMHHGRDLHTVIICIIMNTVSAS
jgi:hypothetical protein